MKKSQNKLTKKNLIICMTENYGDDGVDYDESDEWFRGYDAALEMIAQEFLTNKELNTFWKTKFVVQKGDEQ